MTIHDVICNLQSEKQEKIANRFPCRLILVKDIQQYCHLLSELKQISDIKVVAASEILKTPDVMPNYRALEDAAYLDKWVILTGVGEYLRLFLQADMKEKRFFDLWHLQTPATNRGRILMPLWGYSKQWLDATLHLKNSRQEEFVFDCAGSDIPEQKMNVRVYANTFGKSVPVNDTTTVFTGLREMFAYWENPSPSQTDFVLITKQYRKIAQVSGDINIRVTGDLLTYIRENMRGGQYLTEKNCSEEMQKTLFPYLLEGKSLDEALLAIFNVASFSGADIMGKWETMPNSVRCFVGLWFQLHPDTSYLSHCFHHTSSMDDIVFTVSHEIFQVMDEKPEWIVEFRQLVAVMDVKPDAKYFEALAKIPDYEDQLPFLTNETREERIYLLKMAGKCIAYGNTAIIEKLKTIYPALAAYLSDGDNVYQNGMDAYLSRYKAHKLGNTLPQDEESHFGGVNTELFEKRYSVLHRYEADDTFFLWIDALGAEWLSLLYWSLKNNCDGTISNAALVQADLPTETCYNKQWESMASKHGKLDKLDKLAHKGVVDDPNYYSCVEEQIKFVSSEICKSVTKYLETYRRVVITGDHGTSRLAARFFHSREGIAAPRGATVCSFGRYCKLQQENMPYSPHIIMCDTAPDKFAVFSNYDHFKQSGNATGGNGEEIIYGEVHGGATPEEMLVPVMVVESNKPAALSGSWTQTAVKISRKKAKFTIVFNEKVQSLIVKLSGVDGVVTLLDDGKKWDVVFSGVKAGKYSAEVHADGHIIQVPEITLLSALGGGDGDLP